MGRPRDLDARDRILRSTYDLITTPGADASINAIVLRAGVGKATVYRWWRSRTAVVLDALATFSDAGTSDRIDEEADAWARLHGAVTDLARTFAAPGSQIIKDLLCAVLRNDDEADDIRQQVVRARLDAVAATVQHGISQGAMRADLDVDTVVDTVCGPLYLQLFCGPSEISPEEAVDNVLAIVRPGIAADPA